MDLIWIQMRSSTGVLETLLCLSLAVSCAVAVGSGSYIVCPDVHVECIAMHRAYLLGASS
jgi:hypothetical protein